MDKDAIIARLNELGPEQVRMLLSTGGLPVQWNVTITSWLADPQKKNEPSSAPPAPSRT